MECDSLFCSDVFAFAASILDGRCGDGTCLQAASSNAGPASATERAAVQLLAALGYSAGNVQQTGVRLGAETVVPNDNRRALLSLASRVDDCFQLPLPYAPGAVFVGALVSPLAFDIRSHDHYPSSSAGRGTTLSQSFESCMGETAEFLSFIEWDEDPLICTFPDQHGLRSEELTWALNAAGLCSDTALEELDWVGARSLIHDHLVYLPCELVLRRPAHKRIGRWGAESNGVGAGRTKREALFSALMELVERDAVALWWYGGRPAYQVSEECLRVAGMTSFVRDVRQGSERSVRFLDVSTEFDCSVIVALSSKPDGTEVVAGYSADPDPSTALRKAFLEMCQMELGQELAALKLAQLGTRALKRKDKQWLDRKRTLNLTACQQFSTERTLNEFRPVSSDDKLQIALRGLSSQGFAVYAIDLSRPEIGVHVTRVLIPGLQSCSMKWRTSRLINTARANKVEIEKLFSSPAPI